MVAGRSVLSEVAERRVLVNTVCVCVSLSPMDLGALSNCMG